MSNYLMEDLERILQLETIDKCEVPTKLWYKVFGGNDGRAIEFRQPNPCTKTKLE